MSALSQVQTIPSFLIDLSHMPIDDRAKTNFDHPDSLDTELLVQHIKDLKEGKSVEVPTYDFATHSRTTQIGRAHV